MLEPGRADAVVTDYVRWYRARLRLLDAHLESNRFLCADRFTVADAQRRRRNGVRETDRNRQRQSDSNSKVIH